LLCFGFGSGWVCGLVCGSFAACFAVHFVEYKSQQIKFPLPFNLIHQTGSLYLQSISRQQ
jgi:hypothetical protein